MTTSIFPRVNTLKVMLMQHRTSDR